MARGRSKMSRDSCDTSGLPSFSERVKQQNSPASDRDGLDRSWGRPCRVSAACSFGRNVYPWHRAGERYNRVLLFVEAS